jgi:hypothetical protein
VRCSPKGEVAAAAASTPARGGGFWWSKVDKGCRRGVEETLGVPRREKSCGDEEFAKGEIEAGARRFRSWRGENWRGRRVRLRGSGRQPRDPTCGTAAEGDPAAGTGRGGGGRCRAALVAVPCGAKKAGEVESGCVGRCGLLLGRQLGLARMTSSIYSNIFETI